MKNSKKTDEIHDAINDAIKRPSKAAQISRAAADNVRYDISIAESRKSLQWENIAVKWSELKNKLTTPVITPESVDEFRAMPHDVQADIKDVGGFVGGIVVGGRRVRGSVPFRQILALDLDNSTLPFNAMWYHLSEVWQFRFLIHTTRSYSDLTPRYRCIIPLSQQVDAVQYEAIGRLIASMAGIDDFDPTTYQNTRLMYYPSRSHDGVFYAKEQPLQVLDVAETLARYDDYTDVNSWPYGVNDAPHVTTELATVQDPLQKGGVVGAFCRAYPIQTLLDTKLSNYYTRESNGRYTYVGGSSSGGVVVYDNRWVYSHHSTDPNRERLLNAFDLYRLVMFGAMDTNTKKKKAEELPSYLEMVKVCNTDVLVQKHLFGGSETYDLSLFSDTEQGASVGDDETKSGGADDDSNDWLFELMAELDKNPKTGKIECTLNNYATILHKDPNLTSQLKFDQFDGRTYVTGSMPWERIGTDEWTDGDDASARIYIDTVYNIKPNKGYYDDAFIHVMSKKKNVIDSGLDYINRGEWDGVKRADKLFVNCCGVDDTELNRMQSLLWLKAIVARQLKPGTKFDNMLVLCGEEGIGKSTLFRKLVGDKFFSDSFNFGWDNKKMYEALEGKLIIESAELEGMDKKEAEGVKAFLSSQSDTYRKAYGRRTETIPRRCVFAGTTNQVEVLRSQTGNRRMWIMRCHKENAVMSPFDLTDEYVEQIWAEVRTIYQDDKTLYLPKSLISEQREQQLEFTQSDPLAMEVLQFVKLWLPRSWESLSAAKRRDYIRGLKQGNNPLYMPEMRRETVSAVEFIKEWMGLEVDNKTQYLSKQINTAIRTLDGFNEWMQIRSSAYGRIRSFQIDESVNGVPESAPIDEEIPTYFSL